ncbi:MAG TPA: hypothetical protein PLO87_05685 [Ornithinibacter sp.]|nr:hypothetical protein [Ornithinibacter sp.]HQD68068.1 hypothetical protein [Ornithinibacter sp.]
MHGLGTVGRLADDVDAPHLPWTDESFLVLGIPSVALLRAGTWPRVTP